MTVPQDVFLSRKLRQVAESFLPKLSAELSSKDDVSYKAFFCHTQHKFLLLAIELDDGKFYRKPLYLMVKTMVSCKFSLKPIH